MARPVPRPGHLSAGPSDPAAGWIGLRRWSVVVGVLVVCAGCTSGHEAVSNEERSAQALAGALAEAEAAGADQAQIDVLSGDEVTFAQYQGAIDRALTCMQDAGLEVVTNEVIRFNGKEMVSYAVGSGAVSDADSWSVQDECYGQHAKFVDQFWQTSTPEALAYEERRATALRDPMAECLAGYGIDAPADASFQELGVLAAQHVQAQEDEDCYTDVGYSTWEG